MAACPDPSAHRDTKLQEQASTAALYVTSPARKKQQSSGDFDILDKDNKLSSKGAAMSLKHAKAQDLPSFPSTGGVTTSQSNDAALLANKDHKEFEHWKPDASSAAGKAALLAKDYKMAPLWQPEMSTAGSKAALLAAKDGGKMKWWQPEASADGNSAAAQAFNKAPAAPIQVVTADTRNKALLAATASVRRARSGSAPAPPQSNYPDAANSKHNALNAATVANRPAKPKEEYVFEDPAVEQSRIKYLSDKISREMWTENPPVALEVEEKKHQAALRASAISMANSMYAVQQRDGADATSSHAGATAATTAAGRNSTTSAPDLRQKAMQYIHLQEAAQKLAEERLARLDPDGAERYRAHYGYPTKSPSSRRKLTAKNSTRGRANSDSHLDSSDDERTSRRIRNQMSKFSRDLDEVDAKKQQSDRAALMAAAERKVQAQMRGIDEKVFAQTGKVSPALMQEWEAKARAKAALDSEERTKNFGKTDIGGGKFMSTAEIEAIAAARLKPTLDEITDNAEKRRARDEEIRLDQEEKKRQAAIEKQRAKEHKEIEKRNKQEEKAAAKREKDSEKARLAEEKRQSKAGIRQSKDIKPAVALGTAGAAPIVGEGIVDQVEHEVEAEHQHADGGEETDDTWSDANEEQESPVLSRLATGEAVLRPNVERHVTEIQDSASENELDEEDEHEHNHEQPLALLPETSARETTAAPQESEHMGTDGAISKPAPEALDLLAANNLPGQDPQSSPRRISKLLTKLRRKSKPAEYKPSEASSAAPTPEPKASTSTEPKGSVDAPLKLVGDDDSPPVLPEVKLDASASPSSFVRGRPRSDRVSSIGSDAEPRRAGSKSPVRETRFQEEL